MSTPELLEMQRQLAAASTEIQRLAALRGDATQVSADKKLESIIDTRIIGKIGSFSGNDEDWKHWCFVFESTVGLVDLEGVIFESENTEEVDLMFLNQTPEVQLRMKALYHLLVATTRGRALTILQMVPRNNGAIGWKRLKAEYEPRSGGRLTAMLMGVLKPEWDEAAKKGVRA